MDLQKDKGMKSVSNQGFVEKEFVLHSSIETKDFVEKEKSIGELREDAVNFIYIAYWVILAFTMSTIYLQGFRIWGFHLEPEFLHWLGGATVGEVAGLAVIVYRFLFNKKE